MVAEETMVDVVFRVYTNGTDVFALFPELPGTRDLKTCTCYEHVGQHGSADLKWCMASSRAAQPEEYAPLLRELEGRGYVLNVVKRTTQRHLVKRAAELARARA